MKYKIPVTVIVLGEVEVEASDFEKAKISAMEIAGADWQDMEPNEVSVPEHLTEAMCRA